MKSLEYLERDLNILTKYQFYLNTIFGLIDKEVNSLEELRSVTITKYYSKELSGILGNCDLNKINDYFDFKIVILLDKLVESNNKIVLKCLGELEKLLNKNSHIFVEYNMLTNTKVASLLKNKNIVENAIEYINFEISNLNKKK